MFDSKGSDDEIVFDQGLGDLFIVRTAGQVLAMLRGVVWNSAATSLGAELIVILGHAKCRLLLPPLCRSRCSWS